MKLEFVEIENDSQDILGHLQSWRRAISERRSEIPPKYEILGGHNNLSPNEEAFMKCIRSSLVERGIDPDTVYPIAMGVEENNITPTDLESMKIIHTFSYEKLPQK